MAKIIAIDGFIGFDVTVEDIRQQIEDAKGEDITFEISSGGGLVFEGLAIFNLIKNIEQHTTAHIIGLAGSMASIIPLAANKVIAEKTTVFFIHNARTFGFGDQNELRKTANTLEGLSNLLGRILAEKSGKSIAEISALMDDETFFFGEEMLEAGFVDEIIEGKSDDSKTDAVAFAKLQLEECTTKLKESRPEDYNKIAAQLDIDSFKNIQPITNAQPTKSKATTPAAANQNPNPKVKMDLTQFLTENPTAQKELDSMIATAKTEATATLQAKIDKVVPFIGNTNYPGIASMCSKVLKNESEFSTLEGAVTAFDMIKEQSNSTDATAETEDKGETKAEETTTSTDGMVNSDQDMDAIVEKTKQSIEG